MYCFAPFFPGGLSECVCGLVTAWHTNDLLNWPDWDCNRENYSVFPFSIPCSCAFNCVFFCSEVKDYIYNFGPYCCGVDISCLSWPGCSVLLSSAQINQLSRSGVPPDIYRTGPSLKFNLYNVLDNVYMCFVF